MYVCICFFNINITKLQQQSRHSLTHTHYIRVCNTYYSYWLWKIDQECFTRTYYI